MIRETVTGKFEGVRKPRFQLFRKITTTSVAGRWKSAYDTRNMRLPSWGLALLVGMLVPFVGLLVSPVLAIITAAVGAGAALALLLIPEISVLLWTMISIVFGTGIILLHALLRAVFPALGDIQFLFSLAAFSMLLGGLSTLLLRKGKLNRVLSLRSRGDVLFLVVCLPMLVSIFVVNSRNGFVSLPDGRPHFAQPSARLRSAGEASRDKEEFHARGFVNGDTMTLFALTQATGSREQGTGLLRENPFAGNGVLEYPTLLHRALADVLTATGGEMTRAAWWLSIPVLAGTLAVSALSTQFFLRREKIPYWSAVLLLAVFGSTWESFTYPQSHTFLTGLFFLFVLLLVLRDQSDRAFERRMLRFAIGILAIVLLFSNAVLGTAAVAIAVGSNLLQFFNRQWPLRDRLSGLIGSAILVTLFLFFPPGAGAIGSVNIAYTAVPQMLTIAVPAFLVLWALWDTKWLHRSTTLLGAAVLLPLLGFVTLVFSGRDIIAENSPRFLFLLLLLGWPALIPLIQRVSDWWWRETRHVQHTFAEQVLLWGGGAITVLGLLLPTAASVAGTLDVLVRKPPSIISADELAAFAWIRKETAPNAVILRATESTFENTIISPLALPAFTGRSQLRSEYWLSPDDATLARVQKFFAAEDGEELPGGTYLFCGPEILQCPQGGTPVFSSGAVTIRKL